MNRLTIHVSLIYIETISAGILLQNGLTESLANSVVDLLILLRRKSKSGRHDQVVKGIWRMSWRWEAMKDVVTCDKS